MFIPNNSLASFDIKYMIDIILNISVGLNINIIFNIFIDIFEYKTVTKKINNMSYINTKYIHIDILKSITIVLSFDKFDIYRANPLNIMLNHILVNINFINVIILIPINTKYIDIGINPNKNANMNINLFPNSFPIKISNIDILYDNIKSNVPASFSDNIAS